MITSPPLTATAPPKPWAEAWDGWEASASSTSSGGMDCRTVGTFRRSFIGAEGLSGGYARKFELIYHFLRI